MNRGHQATVHLPQALEQRLSYHARRYSLSLEQVIEEFLTVMVEFVDEDESSEVLEASFLADDADQSMDLAPPASVSPGACHGVAP